MIKDCKDCKFYQKETRKQYSTCRLHGTAPAHARQLKCGIEDAKYFTPKNKFFKSIFEFLVG
ncbi:hypothetical protein [Francisella hispaniensis]|uniref:hypothetical protein n=1 Tax=Francisella hispaniensis TaxID=622488 RepID=UPI0005C72B0B|nr:hypothetical protein [Francisella hispaniensis]